MINESVSSILHELRFPKTDLIEPGLLSVFRMIIGLQLVLVAIAYLTVGNNFPKLPFFVSLSWLTVLMVYLIWPNLHKRLGRWFLPLALILGAAMPLIDRVIFIQASMSIAESARSFEGVEESIWRTLIFLLFPMALTAWQYRMPQVLYYTVGTFIVGVILTGLSFGWKSSVFITVVPISLAQSVVLTLIGYVIFRMISAQREQRAKLTDANEKLANYAATAEQLATSRERNRLARELHDTLSHTLSSLAVQLEAADSVWEDAPDQARNLLVKSIANTRGGLAETRRALQALRASPLEDLGFGLALRNLGESTAKRAGIRLLLDVPKQVEGLSDEQEQGLYRIAQEALENVVKHSNAKSLSLNLAQVQTSDDDDSGWQLTVCDDGVGFEQNQILENGHYGLQGITERTAMLGGELQIDSSLGAGTEIKIKL